MGEAVDQARHPNAHRERPHQVQPARLALGLTDEARCRHGHQQAYRHVYEEHPAPRGDVGQDASEEEAE